MFHFHTKYLVGLDINNIILTKSENVKILDMFLNKSGTKTSSKLSAITANNMMTIRSTLWISMRDKKIGTCFYNINLLLSLISANLYFIRWGKV